MFADAGIIQSVQAAAAAGEKRKGGKNSGEGVIAECCQWLFTQQQEGLLGGLRSARVDALGAELAVLQQQLLSPVDATDLKAKQREIADKQAEIAAAEQAVLWRPSLQAHEGGGPDAKLSRRQKKSKNDSGAQQPLLWRDLALLLMLQAAAMDSALRSSHRGGDGTAAVPRSPSSSPLKTTTPSAGKPSRVQAGGAFTPLQRRDSLISPLQQPSDAATSDSPPACKAVVPEESKQQQQWHAALCCLPYVGGGHYGGGSTSLLPLMQLVKEHLGLPDD